MKDLVEVIVRELVNTQNGISPVSDKKINTIFMILIILYILAVKPQKRLDIISISRY